MPLYPANSRILSPVLSVFLLFFVFASFVLDLVQSLITKSLKIIVLVLHVENTGTPNRARTGDFGSLFWGFQEERTDSSAKCCVEVRITNEY